MELGRIINHKIIIKPSDNKGFIVEIGCGRFIALNASHLLLQLGEYLAGPNLHEHEYNKEFNPSPLATDSSNQPSQESIPEPSEIKVGTGGSGNTITNRVSSRGL